MFCCCVDDKQAKLVELQVPVSATAEGSVLLQSPAYDSSDIDDTRTSINSSKPDSLATSTQPDDQKHQIADYMSDRPSTILVPTRLAYASIQVPIIAHSSWSIRGRDFKIPVLKPFATSAIGLELDTVGGVCGMVMSVVDGAVAIYNAAATLEMQVRPGDFIMGVNGVMGDTAKMARIASENISLELHFRRPQEYTVTLSKVARSTESLGLELEYTSIGQTLLVAGISEGLAQTWNHNHPENRIAIQDRIIEVNGFRGNAKDLLAVSCQSETLALTILRVCANKSWL